MEHSQAQPSTGDTDFQFVLRLLAGILCGAALIVCGLEAYYLFVSAPQYQRIIDDIGVRVPVHTHIFLKYPWIPLIPAAPALSFGVFCLSSPNRRTALAVGYTCGFFALVSLIAAMIFGNPSDLILNPLSN